MKTTTNGNNVSLADENFVRLHEELDKIAHSVGMKLESISTDEVNRFLNLNTSSLQKLSKTECSYGAYLLTRLALFIQKQINRYQAVINRVEKTVDMAIAGRVNEYGSQYTPYAMRKLLAIKDDGYLNEVVTKLNQLQSYIDEINYLPSHCRSLATMLSQLGEGQT